jgi:hypothetical protein
MKRHAIAAALLAVAGCTSGGGDGGEAAAPTTTATAITIGQDPSVPTTSAPPTSDWQVESTRIELLKALERNGFEVAGVKATPVEGGRLFGMTHSWDLRVDGVPALLNLFQDSSSLEGWLQTAEGMGGIVVFSAVDIWALSLESDGPLRARSAKLVTRIGRALVTRELWQVRTIGGS